MNYHGEIERREKQAKMQKVEEFKYTKYKGVDLGVGYMEEPANIMVFRKL
jgi:hypothetical protein